MMLIISGTAEWRALYPGATIGLLELSNVDNRLPSLQFRQYKREIEMRLRKEYAGFTRRDFLSLPVMTAYEQYYKRFDKTYHVQLQVESIVLKGKNLPDVSPLVDANFAAEVSTFVLTAGHDVAKLEQPVFIDVSRTKEEMTLMGGITKPIRAGDMVMRDQMGICCSILYGQDNRSPISAETQHVLYVSYAPMGVPAESVQFQLQQIVQNVHFFAPQAIVEQNRIMMA